MRTDDPKKARARLILELVEKEAPGLPRWLRRAGNQDFEDALQETYANLLAARCDLQAVSNQAAYILTVAKHSLRKVKGSRMIHRYTTSTDHQELVRLADENQIARRASDSEAELQQHMSQALARLRLPERQVLELRRADMCLREIARELNLTVSEVRRRVTRAYARLRRLLASEVQGEKRK